MQHIHFIGIGGVSMSGLAQAMLSRGLRVSGSDPHPNDATARLEAAGATIYRQQAPSNIERERPDTVVVTAAIPPENPELQAARDAGIRVVSRADFLGDLLREFRGPCVAVAGTHGKTTTTAMVAEVLIEGGLDPTVLVGGEYAPFRGNLRLGAGQCCVAEACEAYDSFLSLRPDVTVITNVEADHLDHYGTLDRIYSAFEDLIRNTAHGGLLVWCGDDPGAAHVVGRLTGPEKPARRMAYGLTPEGGSAVWARDIRPTPDGSTFTVLRAPDNGADAMLGTVSLQVPGRHNVLDALAAISVGLGLGVPFQAIAEALGRFPGTGRRYEHLGERDGVLVIDDYAHHPTEIRATISAARESHPDRRLVALFQPHLYSRTRDFMDGFAAALGAADVILVADIYAAREKPMPGVSSQDLAARIREKAPGKPVVYAGPLRDVPRAVCTVVQPGDVVLCMGAGDIREAAQVFLRQASCPDA